ncbi:metal ABC transporter solute-binding protein, Zn/Mn family [Salisediminibacterium halotolerans]|uniref:metal ABC transporter solute-binding protein, Zn/Mn family n=1 Tax=Salisediminibacterium halotolerans TaxID=517425 RepID=UPI000EB22C22|nr:zinc ABC transporter substrate-binding protein [Salisediminibacterium halotolerans]RLJ78056.1 zinc transport system substrate-binding protein [Actinophytocola xinjiangensis]RPE88606.1 zinc transport system substrate-binding protein [Salisediminibacterium halotolerans]TWG37033.1 zinc transport system substrate-binding protein [Salisediminibacterium halotolerans]GEL08297.1 hypothetical protein SHA02_17130 [Salisediminibacterium halotolerans]
MKRTKMSTAILLSTATMLAACGTDNGSENEETGNEQNEQNQQNEAAEDELKVKTTLYAAEFFTEKIGGEHVQVENLVPLGADAHTFEPTANQMIEVAEADLFVYNGAEFEGYADSIEDAVRGEDVRAIEATAAVDLIDFSHGIETGDGHDHDHDDENNHNHDHDDENNHNHDHDDENNHNHDHDDENNHDHDHDDEHNHDDDHSHGEHDPHVWLDPIRSIDYAEKIKDELVDLMPEEEETFEENFSALQEELEDLDSEFKQLIDETGGGTIVVSHAGYGYWEDRYGIDQLGIAGLSPTNEPSIQQLEETIDYMEDHDINHVMFEQNIPTEVAETVMDETDAEELWLHNLETLTEEDAENNEDYFSLMRENIETLETAFE